MFFEFIWTMAAISVINLVLLIVVIFKLRKQEKFQSGEAHINLELINQSLNRLSEIAEKLEQSQKSRRESTSAQNQSYNNRPQQNKERQALAMIRQGQDSRKIGKTLGISKSEIDLLMASEKLGNGKREIRVGFAKA
jgi:DNA-binding CsgD family transcriptional regulator